MKASTILIAILTIFLFSCSNADSKSDIEGIYVTQFKNEYTITADTIIIMPIANSAVFKVERRTGFNKVRDGRTLRKEFKTATWRSTFDISKNILQETELGKQISVKPNGSSLELGNTIYQKVK